MQYKSPPPPIQIESPPIQSNSSPMQSAKTLRLSSCETPIKMAVWLQGYPDVKLFESDRSDLLQKMEGHFRLLEDGNGPQFFNSRIENGRLVATCANIPTQRWFVDCVDAMRRWKGIPLKVGEAKFVPKRVEHKVVTRIPSEMDNRPIQTILNNLNTQNKGIESEDWSIVNIKEESKGRTVVFSLCDAELQKLKDRDLSLFLSFFKLSFSIIEQKAPRSNAIDGPFSGSYRPRDSYRYH